MKKVSKVVIPAAGFGTRFLPQTKAMPKEMLPVVDKPVIQYVVEEAVASGIEDVIIVTGSSKRPIEDHFDTPNADLVNNLKQAKKLGNELHIVVARDANVKKIKGRLPDENENQRMENLRMLNITNNIHLGQLDFDKHYRIINKIKPQIIALGYDQCLNTRELRSKLKSYQLAPQVARLKPYWPKKYKTSLLKNR